MAQRQTIHSFRPRKFARVLLIEIVAAVGYGFLLYFYIWK